MRRSYRVAEASSKCAAASNASPGRDMKIPYPKSARER
jgi:hypothetical protein